MDHDLTLVLEMPSIGIALDIGEVSYNDNELILNNKACDATLNFIIKNVIMDKFTHRIILELDNNMIANIHID